MRGGLPTYKGFQRMFYVWEEKPGHVSAPRLSELYAKTTPFLLPAVVVYFLRPSATQNNLQSCHLQRRKSLNSPFHSLTTLRQTPSFAFSLAESKNNVDSYVSLFFLLHSSPTSISLSLPSLFALHVHAVNGDSLLMCKVKNIIPCRLWHRRSGNGVRQKPFCLKAHYSKSFNMYNSVNLFLYWKSWNRLW